jgi:hypothetical protein
MKLKIEDDVAREIINILQRDLSEEELDELLVEAQETRRVENKKQEDSANDKKGFSTRRGLWMWCALRLAHQLEWRGDYCYTKDFPDVWNRKDPDDEEQQVVVLSKILDQLCLEEPRRFNKKDFQVVYKRLVKSANRLMDAINRVNGIYGRGRRPYYSPPPDYNA